VRSGGATRWRGSGRCWLVTGAVLWFVVGCLVRPVAGRLLPVSTRPGVLVGIGAVIRAGRSGVVGRGRSLVRDRRGSRGFRPFALPFVVGRLPRPATESWPATDPVLRSGWSGASTRSTWWRRSGRCRLATGSASCFVVGRSVRPVAGRLPRPVIGPVPRSGTGRGPAVRHCRFRCRRSARGRSDGPVPSRRGTLARGGLMSSRGRCSAPGRPNFARAGSATPWGPVPSGRSASG